MSETFKRRSRVFHTGLKPSKAKKTKFARFPKSLSKAEIIDLIEDKNRLPARSQFGVEFCVDQGRLGQCNAVAACQSLQRAFLKSGNDCPRLSSNWLYAQINGGQDRGSHLQDGMQTIADGVPAWQQNHHNKFRKRDFKKHDNEATRFSALECYGVDSEIELATGLALGFQAVVAVHVTDDWFNMDKNKIIPECNGPGNHAVSCDDLNIIDGELAFDHMGSWGPNLHDGGRAFLTWKRHFQKAVDYHFFYLIRAAGE